MRQQTRPSRKVVQDIRRATRGLVRAEETIRIVLERREAAPWRYARRRSFTAIVLADA